MRKRLAAAAVAFSLAVVCETAVARAEVLKIATLSRREAASAGALKIWAETTNQKSSGAVTLEIQWNGAAGDDSTMVSSMRSGQLFGATLTSGLGQIDPDLLALGMPGLFTSRETFSRALVAMGPELRDKLAKRGFVLAGWTPIGFTHFMSVGYDVKRPSDLGNGAAAVLGADPIFAALLGAVPGSKPVALSLAEVLPGLGARIGVVDATLQSADQNGWTSHITSVSTLPTGFSYGAIVFAKPAYDALSSDVRAIVSQTAAVAAGALSHRLATDDDLALVKLKQGKTFYEPTDVDKAEWSAVFAKTRAALRGAKNGFTADAYDKVAALAK